MTPLEVAAEHSIARGVGFGALAIALVVAGLAGFPTLAMRSGAALCLLMWAILRLMALRAPRDPYRRTEVWLMLDPRPDWSPEIAQRLVGETRRRILERYAGHTWPMAVAFWVASLVTGLSGLG